MAEPCMSDSTELDCRFLREVQELLAPQSVTQLLEDFQGGLASDTELFPPHSTDQDCSSCSSCGTPANAFESESCIDSTVSADVTEAPIKTKKRAPRTRTHRKTELESLRSQVAQLDKMLKTMQLEEMKATAEGLGDALVGSVMPPAIRLVQQKAAEHRAKSPLDPAYREQIKHIRAVLENLKLRSLFIDQVAIRKDLGLVFRNRPVQQIGRNIRAISSKPEGHFQSPAYELLRANIDARYRQIDSLLQANDLSNCDDAIRRRGHRTDDLQRMVVESVTNRVLPFHRNDIARVFMCLMGMDTVHASLYQLRETLDDTVHIKVVEKHRLSKTDTTITARIVVKRFDEPDRSVIVWEECLNVEGVLPMRVRGNGFNVLRAPLGSGADAPVSIFQSFSAVSPDPLGGRNGNANEQDSAVWELTKLATSSFFCNTDLLDQVIQAVLLSESTSLDLEQPTPHQISAV